MKFRAWVLAMVLVLLTAGCSSKANNDIKKSDNNQKINLKTEEKINTENEKVDEETASSNGEEFYLVENSDKEKLTLDKIVQMKDEDLPFARNEIFARKGYVFKSTQFQDYFSKQNWYKPLDDNSKIELNDIENYNVEKIKEFEDFLNNKSDELKIRKVSIFDRNKEALVDLNNDGKKDKIVYEADYESYRLSVNGVSIEGIGDALSEYFAVVDINSEDNYKEIIVSEYGPSADYLSTYYYYDGKNLIEMGNTEGIFEEGIGIDGSGIIKASQRVEILQTWWFINSFKLGRNHEIANIPKEIFRTNSEVTVKETLDLQLMRNDNSNLLILTPGEKVNIIGTDNERWCLIQKKDGSRGWIELEDYGTIKNKKRDAVDFFEGLLFAD